MGETRSFQIADCAEQEIRALERELGVSGPMAQVLVRRGLAAPAAARAFLDAAEEHPPSAFTEIDTAVQLVLRHVLERTRITIHGDYDVDGVCSTAILVRVLRALGADVDWYLPDRATDGYGLNVADGGAAGRAGYAPACDRRLRDHRRRGGRGRAGAGS